MREVSVKAGGYKPLTDTGIQERITNSTIRVSPGMEMEATEEDVNQNKPKNRPYYQQTLRSWSPLLTPWRAVGGYLLIGLIFVPLGAVFWDDSDIVELK